MENKQPYAGAIACIGSTSDLNMQMNGLKLVNNLIKSAPNEETRKEFFSTLMKLGIHKVLQRQIHIENQNWKEQIISYQYARLEQYNKLRLESYDKNNSAHETLLMQLWKAVFPDQVCNSFESSIIVLDYDHVKFEFHIAHADTNFVFCVS